MDRHVSNARSMTFLVSASLMYVSSLWVNGKKKTAVLNPKTSENMGQAPNSGYSFGAFSRMMRKDFELRLDISAYNAS